MSRLNGVLTLSILLVVAVSLLLGGGFFYVSSARALTAVYNADIAGRLDQINRNIHNQIAIIDSIYPHFMSNTIIRENLDFATREYWNRDLVARRLEIERQMSYMMVNSFLWSEDIVTAVYIFDSGGGCASLSLHKSLEEYQARARTVYMEIDGHSTSLEIAVRHGSIYFIRNIFSWHTGEKIAALVIEINENKWKNLYTAGTDENWLVFMHNGNLTLNLGRSVLREDAAKIEELVIVSRYSYGFQEVFLAGTEYFIASHKTGYADFVSVVAAPKNYLLRNMNRTLRVFIVFYLAIMLASLVFTTLLSYSFNRRILFKNAEIQALRSQIAPHFLFNVLNTIAWKAEMSGNTEVYQMTIALSELLRAGTLSADKDFVTLKEELDYVQFYLYLQKQRFGDKFTAELLYDDELLGTVVPRFSIQPLVENAISHGLEPLPGGGRLVIRIFRSEGGIHIEVEDNGVGFPDHFNINAQNKSFKKENHIHIGLKNLNQRLILLNGSKRGLSIRKKSGGGTVVSFRLPKTRDGV
ncbi:MAG: histidine kinase [Treponema sp.]|jgi:hypothetical protein|nr:histidine kinase [Treponema sp.]